MSLHHLHSYSRAIASAVLTLPTCTKRRMPEELDVTSIMAQPWCTPSKRRKIASTTVPFQSSRSDNPGQVVFAVEVPMNTMIDLDMVLQASYYFTRISMFASLRIP